MVLSNKIQAQLVCYQGRHSVVFSRRFWCFVLHSCCILFFTLQPKTTIAQAKDDLVALVQKAVNQPDTLTINRIHNLCSDLLYAHPDSVLRITETSRQASIGINYRFGEAEALLLSGVALSIASKFDQSLDILEKAQTAAEPLKNDELMCRIYSTYGTVYFNKGNLQAGYEVYYKALQLAEKINDSTLIDNVVNNLGNLYMTQRNAPEALRYFNRSLAISQSRKDTLGVAIVYNNMAEVYYNDRQYLMALDYYKNAYRYYGQMQYPELKHSILTGLGKSYAQLDSATQAKAFFTQVIQETDIQNDALYGAYSHVGFGEFWLKQGAPDKALPLGLKGLTLAESLGQKTILKDGHLLLANAYEALGDGMKAIFHLRKYQLYSDSLNNIETERMAAGQNAQYEINKRALEFERQNLQQKWLTFSALAGALSLAVILFLIIRNRNRLNKTNKLLQHQNVTIDNHRQEVETAMQKLKDTQQQLLQSEKMASLGELTAGIAHEIQNPLNFVNNFAEVSDEMAQELKDALSNKNEEEVDLLIGEIEQNLKRIQHHGKRADSIIKSMLAHSRTASGNKEPTDMNALAKEFLQLSFHGMKAKDHTYHATLHTHLDPKLPLIPAIPQEIGRVLLNLINNALYAVGEKQKKAGEDYNPTVELTTTLQDKWLMVKVKDNGSGIPAELLDKIFQPFFTTKPTGEGTGLGLSLSFDIVTKGHNGQLRVENDPGNGCTFIIQLPAA